MKSTTRCALVLAAVFVGVCGAKKSLTPGQVAAREVCEADFLEPNIEPRPEQFVQMSDKTLKRLPFRKTKVVEVVGASWLRVAFDREGVLAGRTDFRVKIVSRKDRHSQTLNATTLAQWGWKSCYFNGDAVEVTVEGGDALGVVGAVAGEPSTVSTICGETDDRELSTIPRASRYMGGGGCSGWLIHDANHCFLTAGHCGNPAGGGTMQFQVPLSNPDGTINHPAPEDQYPVDPESVQLGNSGVGNDWMYLGTFPNSETGLTAYEAQGDAYQLTTEEPPVGRYTQMIGYGTTSPRNERSQAQQFSYGYYSTSRETAVGPSGRYWVDTTGGNSGSGVESEDGVAFAIHTHGGCTTDIRSSNAGTLLRNPDLQAALARPLGICAEAK